jgi:hypothetical protein
MAEKRKAYWELLRDPRWQKKRLEALNRAEFACQWCEAADVTLNVHHTYYARGAAPWDYPDGAYLVLCENCHQYNHDLRGQMERDLAVLTWDGPSDTERVAGYVAAVVARDASIFGHDDWPVRFRDSGAMAGVADFFGLTVQQLEAVRGESEGGVYSVEFRVLRAMDPRLKKGASDG